MRHNCFSGCGGQHICTQPDQTTAGDFEFKVLHVALGLHHLHFTFPAADEVDYLGSEFFGYINYQHFVRFRFHAIDLFYEYLRLTYGELVSFATHGFDEDTEVEDTATVDVEAVTTFRVFYAEGEVLLCLFHESVAQVATGNELAVASEEW